MTGILTIKKYGTHSAWNMFSEYSMTDAGRYERFVGFTEHEVKELCHAYHVDFEKMKCWYDGYQLGQYNNENALSCVISLAFYTVQEKYRLIRELPTGKGFADIVLIPRPNCKSLENYSGEIILVGISYDKETKKHACVIERVQKGRFLEKGMYDGKVVGCFAS